MIPEFIFLIGFFFTFVGIIGVIRLPDFLSRLHAVSKSDTLGLSLMVLAILLKVPFSIDTFKVSLILFFYLFANPVLTHALSRSFYKSQSDRDQIKPKEKS